MSKQRMTIYVEADIPEKLQALAGGQRKQGDYISELVRSVWANQGVVDSTDVEGLRLQVMGLAGDMKQMQSRFLQMERQLADVKSGREMATP